MYGLCIKSLSNDFKVLDLVFTCEENSDNISVWAPRLQLLCLPWSVHSLQPFKLQSIRYRQHLIEFSLFCVIVYLPFIEQALVAVISRLPSDELVIHNKMESLYICRLCTVCYVTPDVNVSLKSTGLLP